MSATALLAACLGILGGGAALYLYMRLTGDEADKKIDFAYQKDITRLRVEEERCNRLAEKIGVEDDPEAIMERIRSIIVTRRRMRERSEGGDS